VTGVELSGGAELAEAIVMRCAAGGAVSACFLIRSPLGLDLCGFCGGRLSSASEVLHLHHSAEAMADTGDYERVDQA
jgi:hypothetical protein